jgi:hypothetical protein
MRCTPIVTGLVLSSIVFATVSTQAQVSIDLSKITCDEYVHDQIPTTSRHHRDNAEQGVVGLAHSPLRSIQSSRVWFKVSPDRTSENPAGRVRCNMWNK